MSNDLDGREAPEIFDRRGEPGGSLPLIGGWKKHAALAAGIVIVGTLGVLGRTPTVPVAEPTRTAGVARAQDAARATLTQQLVAELVRQEAAREEPPAQGPIPVDPAPAPTRSTAAGGRVSPTGRPFDPVRRDDALAASPVIASRRPVLGGASRQTGRETASEPALDDLASAMARAQLLQAGTLQRSPAAATGLVSDDGARAAAASTARPIAAPAIVGPPAPGLHRLFEGTLLQTVLTTRLDSSGAGPVSVMVTDPVYTDDRTLVIPAGTRVLGRVVPVEGLDDERLAVTFHRLIRPDGTSVALDRVPALNQAGDEGLQDQVNRHFASTFGVSAAMGLITGLSQWLASGFARNRTGTTIVIGGVGEAATQATTQVMSHLLNRRPTITVREGHRVVVYLTQDLDLPGVRP